MVNQSSFVIIAHNVKDMYLADFIICLLRRIKANKLLKKVLSHTWHKLTGTVGREDWFSLGSAWRMVLCRLWLKMQIEMSIWRHWKNIEKKRVLINWSCFLRRNSSFTWKNVGILCRTWMWNFNSELNALIQMRKILWFNF